MRPAPLSRQSVVITGASSGIGRESALRFAAAGAAVTAVARSAEALASLETRIRERGGRCVTVTADVSDLEQMADVASAAVNRFGGIDTWVSAAGMLEYSRLAQTPTEDFRRILEVNLLGQVHGARVALPVMRAAGRGTIISISSVEAVCALPFHAAYAASKAGLDAAMSVLRRELIAERSPIKVVTVRPAVIDTPIYRNARNLLRRRASAPHPHYDPAVAAKVIVRAASRPRRLVYAGGAGAVFAAAQVIAPRLMDTVLGRFGPEWMTAADTHAPGGGNLDRASEDARVRGDLP